MGLGTVWGTHRKYSREGTYFVLFFFFLFFAYCVVLFLKVCWKAYLALFWPPDLEKKKQKHGSAVRILQAVAQSWNFDLCYGGEAGKLINLGFTQFKMNSKLDFRKKDKVSMVSKKPNWDAL